MSEQGAPHSPAEAVHSMAMADRAGGSLVDVLTAGRLALDGRVVRTLRPAVDSAPRLKPHERRRLQTHAAQHVGPMVLEYALLAAALARQLADTTGHPVERVLNETIEHLDSRASTHP